MIVNFRHRGLKRLYQRGDASKLPPEMESKLRIILADLDQAARIED